MKWIVAAAGVLMAAFGAYWAITSYLIVQIERGWSGFISGAVLFAAGMLMLGLAALIAAVDRLARASAAAQDRLRTAREAQGEARGEAPVLAEWPGGEASATVATPVAASVVAPFPAPPQTAPSTPSPQEAPQVAPQDAPQDAPQKAPQKAPQLARDEAAPVPAARRRPPAPSLAASDPIGGPLEAEAPEAPVAPPATPAEDKRQSRPSPSGEPEKAPAAAYRPTSAALRPIVPPPPPRPQRANAARADIVPPPPPDGPAPAAPEPDGQPVVEPAGGPAEPEKTQGPAPEAREAGANQAEPAAQPKAKSFFQRPVGARPKVVREFESQGVRYTLYDDGSIDADAPGQRREFASLDELRDYLGKSE